MISHRRRFFRFACLIVVLAGIPLFWLHKSGQEGSGAIAGGGQHGQSSGTAPAAATKGRTGRGHEGGGPHNPVDRRLVRLFADDKTGLKARDFEAYLKSRGGAPAAVLACYLLADEDPDLHKQIRLEDADAVVLANAPFLPRFQFEEFTETNAAAGLRATGGDPAMAEWLEFCAAGKEADPAKRMEALKESLPKEFPATGDDLRQEMRGALQAVGIEGTQAEILIEQTGQVGSRGSRMVTWVEDAWAQNGATLDGSEKLEFLQSCLDALAAVGSSGPYSSLRAGYGELKILRDLPERTVLGDGGAVAERIAAVQREVDSQRDYQERLNEALFQADPATVDRFYSTLKISGEAAADAVLVPK